MVLPDQPGSIPHLAVAAGKVGSMFFMNEDDLGGYSTETNNVLGTYTIGACWCGPSYFVDPKDGAARVVSSGGSTIVVWKLLTSPSPSLTEVTSSLALDTVGTGFFHERIFERHRRPIIWALSRPTGKQTAISLYAFDPGPGRNHHDATFHGHRRHLVSEWREQQPGSGSSQRKSFCGLVQGVGDPGSKAQVVHM